MTNETNVNEFADMEGKSPQVIECDPTEINAGRTWKKEACFSFLCYNAFSSEIHPTKTNHLESECHQKIHLFHDFVNSKKHDEPMTTKLIYG